MARQEYLSNYCRPRSLTEKIEVEATAARKITYCPHWTHREVRFRQTLNMCGLAGGVCEKIRNPVPVNSPVLKPGIIARTGAFLTSQQTEKFINEMEFPWSSEPQVKRGWMLGREKPWKDWKKEARELAPHIWDNDPVWQEKIAQFRNRPGGNELLAAARDEYVQNTPIILIHPDGT